jgi:hypothetical protein
MRPSGRRLQRDARTFDKRITFAQLSDAEWVVARHCRAGGHARGVTGTLLIALHGYFPIGVDEKVSSMRRRGNDSREND